MTPEQTKQLEAALRELATKATEPPYYVSDDIATDVPNHANSGLALMDTGRHSDWTVARLMEWPTAHFLAALANHALPIIDAQQQRIKELERERDNEVLARKAAEKGWEDASRRVVTQTMEFDTVGRQEHSIARFTAENARYLRALQRIARGDSDNAFVAIAQAALTPSTKEVQP